ncbi:MAG: flotillin family protein [Desulfobulbaceae bacterium]|nr:flotillin family protein [Desulfobulbaceae bacterium]
MLEVLVKSVFIAVIVLVALALIFWIVAKLYKRSSKEVSFVRTGLGGQKVIMDGGAMVLPVFHEVIPVNMNTLRLEVKRDNQQALITRDRMRVDVSAEFYVRVKPSKDSIAAAAQTLGMKTMSPDKLKELIEGKFVDALRSVAAEMAMKELHEQRVDFVQKVQQGVSEDLFKNGLELESVSLTGLDQTGKEFFNPDNAFDAEGLTKLTEEIQSRRKMRNEIEQDTEIAIQNKNLEAEKKQLEITREQEYARLAQQREIEIRKAAQATEIANEQAARKQDAEQARIAAEQNVEASKIESERALEEQRIEKNRLVKEKDILSQKSIETAEIERKKSIEISEQNRAIAIAEKSKEKSAAQAEAEKARALAVQQEEKVTTVKETEIAEREKAVELVEASKAAEKEAIKIKIAAETEKQASLDKAEAVKILANAESEKKRIEAKADADAEIMRAQAAERKYLVDSVGKKQLNEASNTLSDEQIAMQLRLALIKALPQIIEQSVKPMESIEGIKIIQVDGLRGGSASAVNSAEEGAGTGNLADQLVNSALRYRGQAPLVDSLLSDIGLKGSDINGLTSGLMASGSGKKKDA